MKIYFKLALMFVFILVWCLGISGADSMCEQGYLWRCLLMVLVPMLVGMLLVKRGYWDDLLAWMEEKEKKIFGECD